MSKNAAWGGRFSQEPEEAAADYTQSVSYDRALAEYDITGSVAHARMLGRQGVISPEDAATLVTGLEQIRAEIRAGTFHWDSALEDVHMNIETRLVQMVGDVGKKLHTGRSRNDQVGLAFRLYVADALEEWQQLCRKLVGVFALRASEHQGDILPGYTHMQPAQPVSLAQHLLAYAWMFTRDTARFADAAKRARVSPLGAGALAGTTFPLDPAAVAKDVGMTGVFQNSMDAVSDRDYVLEALFAAAACMMHLSRFCEEIIYWANPAFGFVRLPDGYASGSSMMPQKKNPDVAELMRGKVGRVYGALMALLTVMKGLPMTYNRDMQEDKEPFLDAHRTLSSSLKLMASMLGTLTFDTKRMAAACKAGYLNATELADYLAGKGIPFREAHRLTGMAVAFAEQAGKGLEDLTLDELRGVDPAMAPVMGEDVYAVLDYAAAVKRRETHGGTGPHSVVRQLDELRAWLRH